MQQGTAYVEDTRERYASFSAKWHNIGN